MSEPSRRSKLIVRDISESLGKLPPQALDLEETVLGAAMMQRSAAQEAMSVLLQEDFYSEGHGTIFKAMTDLVAKNEPVDMRTVVWQLRENGHLELCGGAYYIAELTSKVSSAANIIYHSRIIKEMAIKRKIIQICSEGHQRAYEDTEDVFALLDWLKLESGRADTDLKGAPKWTTMKAGLAEVTKNIQDRKDSEDEFQITGIPSGLIKLDRWTSGWQPTDLIIIAARPGMGKTSFVLTCLLNASIKFKFPVAVFSMEMASIQLVQKSASIETEIGLKTIKHKKFDHFTYQQYLNKTIDLAGAEIYIDDTAALHYLELRTRCYKLAELGVKLIAIDYIQLMKGDTGKGGNRESEIASISRALKQIAKELGIPVIALSQLSRAVEQRGGNKRPMLSDLRESGAIEQDADMVMFLYRPEYYNINFDEEGMSTQGLAEVIIAKHRNGEIGTVKTRFIGKTTAFKDWEPPAANKDESPVEDPLKTNNFPTAKPSDDTPF